MDNGYNLKDYYEIKPFYKKSNLRKPILTTDSGVTSEVFDNIHHAIIFDKIKNFLFYSKGNDH